MDKKKIHFVNGYDVAQAIKEIKSGNYEPIVLYFEKYFLDAISLLKFQGKNKFNYAILSLVNIFLDFFPIVCR